MTEGAPGSNNPALPRVQIVNEDVLRDETERKRLADAIGVKLGERMRDIKDPNERRQQLAEIAGVTSLMGALRDGSLSAEQLADLNDRIAQLRLREDDGVATETPVSEPAAESAPGHTEPPQTTPVEAAPTEETATETVTQSEPVPATAEAAPAASAPEREVSPEAKENVMGVLEGYLVDLKRELDTLHEDTGLAHNELYRKASSERSDEYAAVYGKVQGFRQRVAHLSEGTTIDLSAFTALRNELRTELQHVRRLLLDRPRDPDAITPESVTSVVGVSLPEAGKEHALAAREAIARIRREIQPHLDPGAPIDPRLQTALGVVAGRCRRINLSEGLQPEDREAIQAAQAELERLLPPEAPGRSFGERMTAASREFLTTPHDDTESTAVDAVPAPATVPETEAVAESPFLFTPADITAFGRQVAAMAEGRFPEGYHVPDASRSRLGRNVGLALAAAVAGGLGTYYAMRNDGPDPIKDHTMTIAPAPAPAPAPTPAEAQVGAAPTGVAPAPKEMAEPALPNMAPDQLIRTPDGQHFTTAPAAKTTPAIETQPTTTDATATVEGGAANEPILYTFTEGSPVNGISKALDAVWQEDPTIISVPLDQAEFDRLKESVLLDVEANSADATTVAHEVGVTSLNDVQVGQQVDLTVLIERINQKALGQ